MTNDQPHQLLRLVIGHWTLDILLPPSLQSAIYPYHHDQASSCGPFPEEEAMIPLDLSGKVALVTGVGDNESFAWFIAKALQAAGARLVWGVHPRMIRIVEGFLTSDKPDDVASRVLPYGAGNLTVEKVLPCDVGYDTMADVPEAIRTDRRYTRVEEQY